MGDGTAMTSTTKAPFLFVSFLLTASMVHAQDNGTTHVFPQIVDGVQGDGDVFTSRFWIASIAAFPLRATYRFLGSVRSVSPQARAWWYSPRRGRQSRRAARTSSPPD